MTFFFNSAANIKVFKQTSYYIVIKTSVGLEALVQLSPLMQVFVTIQNSFKGRSSGKPPPNVALLCQD